MKFILHYQNQNEFNTAQGSGSQYVSSIVPGVAYVKTEGDVYYNNNRTVGGTIIATVHYMDWEHGGQEATDTITFTGGTVYFTDEYLVSIGFNPSSEEFTWTFYTTIYGDFEETDICEMTNASYNQYDDYINGQHGFVISFYDTGNTLHLDMHPQLGG